MFLSMVNILEDVTTPLNSTSKEDCQLCRHMKIFKVGFDFITYKVDLYRQFLHHIL